DAVIFLDSLQQVAHLDIRVAVVRIPDLTPSSEQRVGFIEEQNGIRGLRFSEDTGQVLLRLADELADDGGEIDFVEVERELAGDDLRRHRLPGARGTGKQRTYAVAV